MTVDQYSLISLLQLIPDDNPFKPKDMESLILLIAKGDELAINRALVLADHAADFEEMTHACSVAEAN